jgi:hypothetical protein
MHRKGLFLSVSLAAGLCLVPAAQSEVTIPTSSLAFHLQTLGRTPTPEERAVIEAALTLMRRNRVRSDYPLRTVDYDGTLEEWRLYFDSRHPDGAFTVFLRDKTAASFEVHWGLTKGRTKYPMEGRPAGGEILVDDESRLLSSNEMEKLFLLLNAHNEKGPGRISILIINELPPDTTIENYASKKINEQPLSDKLDRILLLVAVKNRKMRIETSKEVWKVVPDAFCKGVIDDVITPKFKQKQYYDGLNAGIRAVIVKLRDKKQTE